MLASTVNSQVHASPIFTYESARGPLSIFTYGSASEPPSPLNELSAESVIPKKLNPKTHKNPPNPVLYVPADPDPDSSLSDSSSGLSDSSDDDYYKLI